MKKAQSFLAIVMLVSLAFSLAGCAGNVRSFTEERVNLELVKKIAVLPLENHTKEEYASARLRDLLTTAILSNGLFRTVSKGELEAFLNQEIADSNVVSLDVNGSQKLSEQLGLDAYMTGSVDDYSEVRNGPYSYPVVAATLQMIDANTGTVLWQASGTASGYSTWGRLFGFASRDINQVSFDLMEKLLKTMR